MSEVYDVLRPLFLTPKVFDGLEFVFWNTGASRLGYPERLVACFGAPRHRRRPGRQFAPLPGESGSMPRRETSSRETSHANGNNRIHHDGTTELSMSTASSP